LASKSWTAQIYELVPDLSTPAAAILVLLDDEDPFNVTSGTVSHPYVSKWKVLNRGAEAERRNNIRGQIIESRHPNARHERTSFRGEHVVECFVVKDGIVVARDRIDVPISNTSSA
jgi:hypothetical protein